MNELHIKNLPLVEPLPTKRDFNVTSFLHVYLREE